MTMYRENEIVCIDSGEYAGSRGLVVGYVEEGQYDVIRYDGSLGRYLESRLGKLQAASFFAVGDVVSHYGKRAKVIGRGFNYPGDRCLDFIEYDDSSTAHVKDEELLLISRSNTKQFNGGKATVRSVGYSFMHGKTANVVGVRGNTITLVYNGRQRFLYNHELELVPPPAFAVGQYVRIISIELNSAYYNQIATVFKLPETHDGYRVQRVDRFLAFKESLLKPISDEDVWKVNNHVKYQGQLAKLLEIDGDTVKILAERGGITEVDKSEVEPYKFIADNNDGVQRQCECCGEDTDIEDLRYLEGYGFICESCEDDNSFSCTHCGGIFSDNEEHFEMADGEIICESCRNIHYYTCDECGRIMLNDDIDDGLCPSCQEDYDYCSNCGRRFNLDDLDEDGLCDRCQRRVIQDYYYKPTAQFFGSPDNKKYLGMEWEIAGGGENHSNAKQILDGNEELYAKHDSSVSNGFEIVTHPMSAEYHLNEFDWAGTMKRASNLGYEGKKGTGIHVHISRRFFGIDEEEQAGPIANLIYFVEKNWSELVAFSNRQNSEVEQWADRYLPAGDNLVDYDPEDLYDLAVSRNRRYHTVNLKNEATIEIRCFRSSVQWAICKGYLQFVDLITDLSMDKELAGDFDFHDVAVAAKDKGYTELVRLIAQRLPNVPCA